MCLTHVAVIESIRPASAATPEFQKLLAIERRATTPHGSQMTASSALT